MDIQRRTQINRLGKAFVRDGDMWAFPAKVIDAKLDFLKTAHAIQTNAAQRPPLSPDKFKEQAYLRSSFARLTSIYEGLGEELAAQGPDHRTVVEQLLTKGTKEARMADTHTITVTPPAIHTFIPTITSTRKADKGFHHQATRALLFPVIDMERVRSGDVLIGSGTTYHFMYEGCVADPKQPLKAWIVLFGPSFARASEGELNALRHGKKCNAYRNRIKQISMRFIAYITTLVHFALSSDTSLSPGDPRISSDNPIFTYSVFYRFLVDFLESPDPNRAQHKFRTKLLVWWNSECFFKGPSHSQAGNSNLVGESTRFSDLFDEGTEGSDSEGNN
ncbi:hypothetical protein BOTBODRAFT_171529 [Botryobasidium botryosum FD-172 SS1]|uniref:Fungal-type protein kinase domain-containing protein n=1 Tax=Botryobasidium botryosum (strain FD-172 SS1) TaxID=930990 RepID=A0A067MVN1_BOTB1|nr:hypothetical protein BOTBODRAFT_171529 [Botryobasidium botryosum FD-172 SS1]